MHLLRGMTDVNDPSTAGTISLDSAAGVCQLPASALLPVLRTDPVFVVKQSSSGGYSVGLNAAALLRKGRNATKAGVLVEELPPPAGYVSERHPIRPGADCQGKALQRMIQA